MDNDSGEVPGRLNIRSEKQFYRVLPCRTIPSLASLSAFSSSVPATALNRVSAVARILLVDDDPALLSALPESLTRRLPGCEIVTADCGETALSLLRDDGFDVVISDLWVSDVGGSKFFAELEQLSPSLPTIIMTGTLEWPGEKLPASAVGVVRKPFDASKLVGMVRGVLEKRSVSQS